MPLHVHKCQHCGQVFQCSAPQRENFDGWPDVICESYHIENQDWCDECLHQMVVDQAHDEWWEGIGSPELDSGVYDGGQ